MITRAYGNTETDVFAYRNIGIKDERIFIMGKFSGSFGVVGLGPDFTAHYKELASGANGILD